MRAFALLLALLAVPARAEGPVASAPSLDAALAGAGAAAPAPCALPAGGLPPGRFWLRRGAGGLELVAEDGVSPEALAFWTDAALGAAAAAEALRAGDGPADLAVMIEARDGAVALFDGRATLALDPCAALDRLAAAMAGAPASAAAPGAALAPAAAPGAATVVAPGGAAAAALTLPGAGPPEAWALRGPDGVTGAILAVDDRGAADIVVAAAPGAAPGRGALRLYRADDPFRPVATLPVEVAGAAGPAPAAPARLAPGERLRGAVAVGGETTVLVEIPAEGAYRFRSLGAGDLAARLEAPDGTLAAADDDGGEGYGFALTAVLAPGEHRLVVRHCCGGGGAFEVVAENP